MGVQAKKKQEPIGRIGRMNTSFFSEEVNDRHNSCLDCPLNLDDKYGVGGGWVASVQLHQCSPSSRPGRRAGYRQPGRSPARPGANSLGGRNHNPRSALYSQPIF